MNKIVSWSLAGIGSIGAHLLMFGFLTFSIDPKLVEKQASPTSRMQIITHKVRRTEAAETIAAGQHLRPDDGKPTGISQGAIPQSNARVSTKKPDKIQSLLPKLETSKLLENKSEPVVERPVSVRKTPVSDKSAEKIELTKTLGDRLPEIQVPTDLLIASSQQRPKSITAQVHLKSTKIETKNPVLVTTEAALPSSHKISSGKLTADINLAQVIHAGLPVEVSSPDASALLPKVPLAISAPLAKSKPTQLSASAPDVDRANASLAFSGALSDTVDPVSLAAIQSFMQPSDLLRKDGSAGTVRDGIADILSRIPCSRLQVLFVPETGVLEVNGHIPNSELRGPVLTALKSKVGEDITLSNNLLVLPRPQCGALVGIANVGLAQSTDQFTDPFLVGENAHAREFRYSDGQRMVLDLTAPDYDAYLYIDYFDADGQVIHLAPNDFVPLEHLLAQSEYIVGGENKNGPSLNITISPPFGQEIAVAFAASSPLYEGTRPLVESAEPYLEWMKKNVAQARAENSGFKGEWVYFFVSTAPQ